MAKKKAAPVVEEIEEDEEDLELEDLEEEAEEETPKAKKSKAKGKSAKKEVVDDGVWGIRNGLIPLIEEKTGKEYNAREIRTLLRKMARDGGRIDREIVAGNKSKYAWEGPDDPEVKIILKAIKGGEIEAGKKEALDKLKSSKAKKDADAGKATPPKKKKAKPPVDEDEEDDDED